MNFLERISHWKKVATDSDNPPTGTLDAGLEEFLTSASMHSTRTTSKYQQYMQSREWQCKRQEKFTNVQYRCEQCGRRRHLAVHHLHYKTFMNEGMEDLKVLCDVCHAAADEDRRRKAGA